MIVYDLQVLKDICAFAKAQGKKIGFTNWCFDIIHPWHIHTFKEAKNHCDILVVAINSDTSPYRKTKPGRPIHNQNHRAIILDSIRYVDYVIFFDEETPIVPISKILPDVLVKGGDYKAENVVWYQEVVDNGGQVIIIPTIEGYSTTNSVKKILDTKYYGNDSSI